MEAIEKMKTPENLRDVQCFLGMLGYYRQFVPEFATLAEPLTFLLLGKVFLSGGRSRKMHLIFSEKHFPLNLF